VTAVVSKQIHVPSALTERRYRAFAEVSIRLQVVTMVAAGFGFGAAAIPVQAATLMIPAPAASGDDA
jgi:hypothetical protein